MMRLIFLPPLTFLRLPSPALPRADRGRAAFRLEVTLILLASAREQSFGCVPAVRGGCRVIGDHVDEPHEVGSRSTIAFGTGTWRWSRSVDRCVSPAVQPASRSITRAALGYARYAR